MAHDAIFTSWLEKQEADAAGLNDASDIVKINQYDPQRYLAAFSCRGLLKTATGSIEEADAWLVAIAFSDDYLREFNPAQTLCVLQPNGLFHPNARNSAICPGHMMPGTGLVDLVDQIHQILTYQHMNLNDPLNRQAADWAREHRNLFPIDRRPLRRRILNFELEEVANP